MDIDNLISKVSTVGEANALFKAKDVTYSQKRYSTYIQPDNGWIGLVVVVLLLIVTRMLR